MLQHPPGRPWIHDNHIVPSTLHQCFKYVSADNQVRRVFAEKKPFKGKEIYFADSKLYAEAEVEKEESIPPAHADPKDKEKKQAESRFGDPLAVQTPGSTTAKASESGSGKSFVIQVGPKGSTQQIPFVVPVKANKTTNGKSSTPVDKSPTEVKCAGKYVIHVVSVLNDTDSESESDEDQALSPPQV